MEPMYEGEPILAVAAVDELTAAEAIERIVIEFEPLPFVVDPVASLRPGSPNARTQGNTWMRPAAAPGAARWPGRGAAAAPKIIELKWTEEDFANARGRTAADGQADRGVAVRRHRRRVQGCGARPRSQRWVGQNTSHQVLEPRSAMAYWQNGKLYLHAGTQSTVQTVPSIARWVGIDAKDIVLISEYTRRRLRQPHPGLHRDGDSRRCCRRRPTRRC